MCYDAGMPGDNNTRYISISTDTMIRGVLVALAVFLFWYLWDLVMIILTSIIFASFVESLIPYYKKIRIGRITGVVITYIIFALFTLGLFYLFAPLLITELYNLSGLLSKYLPDTPFLNYFSNDAFSGASSIVSGITDGLSLQTLIDTSNAFIDNLSASVLEVFSVAFGSIFNLILIVIISFYLSVEEKGIEKFLRIVIPIKYEDYAVDLWDRTRRKIALWVKGQMLLAVLVGVLVYLVLSLLGNDYALLLAIIAGLFELIPYGTIIALIPAFSFSYLSGGFQEALLVSGAFVIIHQFEVYLFSPLIINKVVGLSPFVIILSAVIGLELAGVWGVVLAIPLSVFFLELMNDVEKKKIKLKSHDA